MSNLARKLENVLTAIAVGMFLVFIFSITYQVAARFVPFVPRYYWTEEISRVTFIWMTFICASIGVKNSEHFLLDVLPLEPDSRRDLVVNVIAQVLILAIAILTMIGAVEFTIVGLGRASSNTGIGLSWYYLSIVLSFLVMILFTVLNIIAMVTPSRGKQ